MKIEDHLIRDMGKVLKMLKKIREETLLLKDKNAEDHLLIILNNVYDFIIYLEEINSCYPPKTPDDPDMPIDVNKR